MKAERQGFHPVTVTFDTQEELDGIYFIVSSYHLLMSNPLPSEAERNAFSARRKFLDSFDGLAYN